MNGAAMNCRQDPGLRPQHRDSSSHHNPGSGYHLPTNYQQNLQPQNSKTLNYQSLSTNSVDGFNSHLHQYENVSDTRHFSREIKGSSQRPRAVERRNEPMDLPVPQFVIDEHSVSHVQKENDILTGGSKGLDLDTRIGILLKSKALAGMHPIFSDLNDSEESGSDLDDPLLSRPRYKSRNVRKSDLPIERYSPIHESFDDPEKPLSRPPSPFRSRATYLFWFNKAIEIKQQAKAQEQALLEEATKRLIQDTSRSIKKDRQKKPIPKTLIDEISKELKEVIKQEFIREVIEQSAFNALDDWWEKQNQDKNTDNLNICNLNSEHCDLLIDNREPQGSTSPKMPYPWEKQTNEEKTSIKNVSLKSVCQKKEMLENQTSRTNNELSLNQTHADLKDKEVVIDCHSSKDQNSMSEEMSGECDVSYEAVSTRPVVKLDKDFVSKELDPLNAVLFKYNEHVSDSLATDCETNQLPASNEDSSQGSDKFSVVKDILEIICYNVDQIIVQRYVSACPEVNETLPNKNCCDVTGPTNN